MNDTGLRNAAIVRKRLFGATYRALAEEYGITVERVRQIVARAAVTPEARARERAEAKAQREATREANRRAIERRERYRYHIALVEALTPIVAHWDSLYHLGYWLQEVRGLGRATSAHAEAWDILTQWFEGNANETMTVLRLRRLAARVTTEVEGEAEAA